MRGEAEKTGLPFFAFYAGLSSVRLPIIKPFTQIYDSFLRNGALREVFR